MDLVEDENEAKIHMDPPQSIEQKNTTEEDKIDEILEFLLSTETEVEKEAQSVKSTKIYPQNKREAQSAKSTKIYPEIYPELASTAITKEDSTKAKIYPVIYPEKQHSSKEEEPINPKEASIEGRAEIYPENSIGATRGSLQSRREESTPQEQKIKELSNFKKEIIEMFEIPENFKEISNLDIVQVDLDLQSPLNLPLEENSLLDLLIDSKIV